METFLKTKAEKDIKLPQTERDFNAFFAKERKKTISFLRHEYNLPEESAEGVYQDSCIALFLNIKEGKLVSLTSSLSTYFTRICINQTLKTFRNSTPVDSIDDERFDHRKVDEIINEGSGFSVEQQQAMADIVNNMSHPCNVILWSYYYDNMSMNEIASVINYKNSDTVKAKKTQCMQKLKNRFSDTIKDIVYGEND